MVWFLAILLIIIGSGFYSGYSNPRYLENQHKLKLLAIMSSVLFLFGIVAVSGESYFWSAISFGIFFWFVGVVLGEIARPEPKQMEQEPDAEPEPDPYEGLSHRERIEELKKRTRN